MPNFFYNGKWYNETGQEVSGPSVEPPLNSGPPLVSQSSASDPTPETAVLTGYTPPPRVDPPPPPLPDFVTQASTPKLPATNPLLAATPLEVGPLNVSATVDGQHFFPVTTSDYSAAGQWTPDSVADLDSSTWPHPTTRRTTETLSGGDLVSRRGGLSEGGGAGFMGGTRFSQGAFGGQDGGAGETNVPPFDFERAFGGMSDQLGGGFGGIGNQIGGMYTGLGSQVSGLGSNIGNQIGSLEDLMRSGQMGLGSQIGGLGDQLGGLYTGLGGQMSGLGSQIGGLGNQIGTQIGGMGDRLGGQISGLGTQFGGGFDRLRDLMGGLDRDVGGLGTAVSGLGLDLGGQLTSGFGDIEGMLRGPGGIGNQISGLGGRMGTGFGDIERLLGGLRSGMGEQFSGMGGQLGGIEAMLGAPGGIGNQISGLGGQMGTGFGDIERLLGGLRGGLGGQISGLGSDIGGIEAMLGAPGGIGNQISGLGGQMGTGFGDIESLLGGLRSGMGEKFSGMGDRFSGVEGLLSGLGGQVGGMQDMLSSNQLDILNLLGDKMGTGFGNVGRDLTSGFGDIEDRLSGMGSNISDIIPQLGGSMQLFADAMADRLTGIRSGIGGDIGGMEGLLGTGLGGVESALSSGLGGIEGQLGGLEGLFGTGLGGLESGIGGLEGRLGGLEGLLGGFGGQLGGIESMLSGFDERLKGIEGQPDIEAMLDQMGPGSVFDRQLGLLDELGLDPESRASIESELASAILGVDIPGITGEEGPPTAAPEFPTGAEFEAAPEETLAFQAPDTPGLAGIPGKRDDLWSMLTGQTSTPFMDPILNRIERRQAQQLDEARAGLASRGILNSTPAMQELADLTGAQDAALAQAGLSALSQVAPQMIGAIGQTFGQDTGVRNQAFDEFMRMVQAQQGLDTQGQGQQNQSLAMLLNALGQGTINPAMPNFSIPQGQPGMMQSLGSLAGNIGSAYFGTEAGSQKLGEWLGKIL
jgi:hypothetical protein